MNYHKILKEICQEEGIELSFLSDDWVKVLKKDNQVHYIQGYKFDLNGHGIASIMDDKGLFYDVMRMNNLPIIEHKTIFKDYNKDDVLNYFAKNNYQLIIKGNIGTCGKEVFLVQNKQDLLNKIEELFLSQYSISLCPYYDIINEYRVIVLNGKERIVYGKERGEVVGDGVRTILELAQDFNDYYASLKNPLPNSDKVLEKGEKSLLNYQFNLSNGAKMFLDIDENLRKQIVDLALLVARRIGITFGSIDIIYTKDKRLLVMEANSGVMMENYIRQDKENGYNKAFDLYRDAIKTMFKENN